MNHSTVSTVFTSGIAPKFSCYLVRVKFAESGQGTKLYTYFAPSTRATPRLRRRCRPSNTVLWLHPVC